MAKTYEQLQREILALQAEAETLRRRELDAVVEQIRTLMAAYDLTAADLGLGGRKSSTKGAGKKAAAQTAGATPSRPAGKGPVRALAGATYRDDSGRSWAGRGKRPQWLRDALLAGRTLDEFRVRA